MTDPADVQAELGKIEQALASIAAALSGEACAAAQQPLLERKAAILKGAGVIVQGNQNKVVASGGILIEGSVYLGSPPKNPEEALAIYRRVVAETTASLPLRGVDVGASDASTDQKPVRLSNVYIALDTHTPTDRNPAQSRKEKEESLDQFVGQKTRALTALEAVIAQRRLVLLGDPGGGKSTFVNFLAHCLASQSFEPLTDWPENERKALPVSILLRDFARRLPEKLPEHAEPRHLLDFIARRLKEQNLSEAAGPIRQALEAGNGVLLLDGLDEIPTPAQRRFVRDAIAVFARRYPGCRVMVTCRVLSYQDGGLRLADFPVFELATFDAAKIDQFIQAWYLELTHLGSVPAGEAPNLAGRLSQAVRRADLWRLAPNPLLLTVMALVHTHKGRLPDARAQLYEDTVDILLWRWEQIKAGGKEDAPRLRQLLLDAGRGDVDLKRVLWTLAYEAHAQVGMDQDGEKLADIGELKLQKALAALSRNGSLDWAAQVIEAMKLRAGLLLERMPSVFTFPHRTFQEYLAGAHLAAQANFAVLGKDLSQQGALWREVILLAAGKLVYLHGDLDKPLALVGELCPARIDERDDLAWRKTWLAGDVLLEVGLQRACDSNLGCDLLERVRQRLADLLRLGKLSPVERTRAGDTLAKLGDPRFDPEHWHLPKDDTLGFIPIPGGSFTMGTRPEAIAGLIEKYGGERDWYERETPQHEVTLPGFWIARYPVTVAQFRQFVEDGGIEFNRWQWNTVATHPVVEVTWYEALKYCGWLDEKLKGAWQPAGPGVELKARLARGELAVTLPSEAEWEKAARGADGRQFPWGGSEADPNRMNIGDTGIGDTSVVGCFPAGCSPYEVLDLSGNVLEWTRSIYGKYPYPEGKGRQKREDLTSTDTRVLRGGAFNSIAWFARCAFRDGCRPVNRLRFAGFRVVLSPLLR